jgi:hypothetical protein
MRSGDMRRSSPVLVFVCLAGCVLMAAQGVAQAPTKKVVRTEADLPRFTYPVPGTATELVTADDATFNAFAAKVRTDVDSVLNDYDIQDRAALRGLLNTRIYLELLAGDNKAAVGDGGPRP